MEIEEAEALKVKGNESFKAGKLDEAIDFFSQAIGITFPPIQPYWCSSHLSNEFMMNRDIKN
jgi:hypothetical protein